MHVPHLDPLHIYFQQLSEETASTAWVVTKRYFIGLKVDGARREED